MNVKLIAAILLSAMLITAGVASLVANSLGWKKFRHSFFTLVFLSEKRWEQPLAKIFNVAWGLLEYSVGFWILITKVFS